MYWGLEMTLKQGEGDKCPWLDFRGEEVGNPVVNFAMCYDCPKLIEMTFYGEASDNKTHNVEIICKEED